MNQFKIIVFLWQSGVIDSLTFYQYILNLGSQYSGMVLAQVAADSGPGVLLTPFKGLGTGVEYIATAPGRAERARRVATLASALSMSGSQAAMSDPATNAGLGAVLCSFIENMKSVIEKSKSNGTGGLVFTHPQVLSKFTPHELRAINLCVTSTCLLIIILFQIPKIPTLTKKFCSSVKKLKPKKIILLPFKHIQAEFISAKIENDFY